MFYPLNLIVFPHPTTSGFPDRFKRCSLDYIMWSFAPPLRFGIKPTLLTSANCVFSIVVEPFTIFMATWLLIAQYNYFSNIHAWNYFLRCSIIISKGVPAINRVLNPHSFYGLTPWPFGLRFCIASRFTNPNYVRQESQVLTRSSTLQLFISI